MYEGIETLGLLLGDFPTPPLYTSKKKEKTKRQRQRRKKAMQARKANIKRIRKTKRK